MENLAAQLQVAPETIDPKQPFMELGLESIAIFTLTGDLAQWLGRELPATSLWEYPTIEALSHHLAEENA